MKSQSHRWCVARNLNWCAVVACFVGSTAVSVSARAELLLLDPSSDLIGAIATTRADAEDTLTDIARRSGLGYEDMRRANPGVDPWLPGTETDIVLPTHYVLPSMVRKGVVVNIAEYRLYYFTQAEGREVVATFPVSIGRMDWETPIGQHRITAKQVRPVWYPPDSVRAEHAAEGDILPRAIPPGPANPLGDYAIRLSHSSYLIHGTNKPVGIGMQVTHGCIRMYPEDIEWLFPQLAADATVEIVNEPLKFGWDGADLYFEAHPRLDGDGEQDAAGLTGVTSLYVRATTDRPAVVDWAVMEEVYRARLGIPVRVGRALAPARVSPAIALMQDESKYPLR